MLKEEFLAEHEASCRVGKARFPKGEWTDEPNWLHWKHEGLDCLIVRNHSMGHLCGYVAVEKNHPLFGKEYEKPDVDVHGGLTYARGCSGVICHKTEEPEEAHWFGFDCAHLWDLVPAMLEFRRGPQTDIYRNIAYVKKETESLARQLAEIGKNEPKT